MPSLEPVYILPHSDPILVQIRAHSQTGKGVGEVGLDFFFFFCKTPFNANYTLILLILEFFFLWLGLVFITLCRLFSLVVMSRGSSLWCMDFSLQWPLSLWSRGPRAHGLQ